MSHFLHLPDFQRLAPLCDDACRQSLCTMIADGRARARDGGDRERTGGPVTDGAPDSGSPDASTGDELLGLLAPELEPSATTCREAVTG